MQNTFVIVWLLPLIQKKEIIYSEKRKKKLKEEIFGKEIKKGGKKLFDKQIRSSNIA